MLFITPQRCIMKNKEYQDSLEWFIKAKEFTKPGNKAELKLAELGCASAYEKLRDYDSAIEIYTAYGMTDRINTCENAKEALERDQETTLEPQIEDVANENEEEKVLSLTDDPELNPNQKEMLK